MSGEERLIVPHGFFLRGWEWGGVGITIHHVVGKEQQRAGAPCQQECEEILTSSHLQEQNTNGAG